MILSSPVALPIFPLGFFIFFLICLIIYQIVKIAEYISKNSKMREKQKKNKCDVKRSEYKPDVGIVLIPTFLILSIIIIGLFSLFAGPGPVFYILIYMSPILLILVPIFACILKLDTQNNQNTKNFSFYSKNNEVKETPKNNLEVKQNNRKTPKYIEKQCCPKCGMKFADEALFCHNCGKPKNTEVRFCQYCGKERVEDANFCDKCGNLIVSIQGLNPQYEDKKKPKAQEEIRFCNSCGAERESEKEEFYCSNCGVRF